MWWRMMTWWPVSGARPVAMLMIARYVSYHPIIAIMYSPEAIIRPDQNNTKPPATTQWIFGENGGKLLVTPTHLPSLFPPESLRSRLLSWISMKGNCYFCNKLYRWCSEVKGKYICGNISTMFRNLQRLHWLQCLGGDPSRLAKINWLLDSGNRFTSRPSLTTSETLINGQWPDNNIFQILIFNKCAIFGVMWFSWSSLVSPSVSVRLSPCSKSPISMQISQLILRPWTGRHLTIKVLVPGSKWKWGLLETIRWHSNCGPLPSLSLNFGFQSEFRGIWILKINIDGSYCRQ